MADEPVNQPSGSSDGGFTKGGSLETSKTQLIKKSPLERSSVKPESKKKVVVKKKVIRHHRDEATREKAKPLTEQQPDPVPSKHSAGEAPSANLTNAEKSSSSPTVDGQQRQREEPKKSAAPTPTATPQRAKASSVPIGTILSRRPPGEKRSSTSSGPSRSSAPPSRDYRDRRGAEQHRTGGGFQQGSNRDRPHFRRDGGGPHKYEGRRGEHNSASGNRPAVRGAGHGPGGNRPGGGRNAGHGGSRPPFRGGGRSGGSFNAAAKPAPPISAAGKSTSRRFGRSGKKNVAFDRQESRKAELEQAFNIKNGQRDTKPANPVPKEILITEVITVAELARKMNLKGSDLIGKLMKMGMMVTINQQIDAEIAAILAEEYQSKVTVVSLYDETVIQADTVDEASRQRRPAVVTVMGHVDHGKTKLLDSIRRSNVASQEHGGITQHIGAYQVKHNEKLVTFLDTPGHEAFTLMRARGASVTDIVVLVVAADDGVMPQTVEAIRHAQEAKVPIIVAINKIDLAQANPDRIMQQLSEHQLIPEECGGHTQFVKISALNGDGIDKLLEKIELEAEMLDLKVGFDCRASGRVIESFVDQGRGIVATLIIQEGTLKIGDSFVAGVHSGKVRAMFNEFNERIQQAPPGSPVEIIGFNGCPDAGAPVHVVESERQAKQFEQKRQELQKLERSNRVRKVSLDNLYDTISEEQIQELRVIIKGDVHGSVEALQQLLEKLSNDDIRLRCIHSAAGAILESDVSLAAASKGIIIGFHVRPTPRAQSLAEKERVEIRKYNVIYDAVKEISAMMEGMLVPEITEREIGSAEIREVFKISRLGTIAGCMVKSGILRRGSSIQVLRNGETIFSGELSSLKRFKDDVKEVREGFECGVTANGFNEFAAGDLLQCFVIEEVARKLDQKTATTKE